MTGLLSTGLVTVEKELQDWALSPRTKKIIETKVIFGLARWARKKMANEMDSYITQARTDFVTRIWKAIEEQSGFTASANIRAAFLGQQVDFPFPKLKKKSKFTFLKLVPRILAEYKVLRPKIARIQKRCWRNPKSHHLSLVENLPGINSKTATCYASMKASSITYNYLARKYRLGFSGEALRKSLKPMKALENTLPGLEDIDRLLSASTKSSFNTILTP